MVSMLDYTVCSSQLGVRVLTQAEDKLFQVRIGQGHSHDMVMQSA